MTPHMIPRFLASTIGLTLVLGALLTHRGQPSDSFSGAPTIMASGSGDVRQPSPEAVASSSTESTVAWTLPSTVYTPPSDDGEWPTLNGPREVLVGAPFTVTGVCNSVISLNDLQVYVGYGDFTQPNWNASRIHAPNEPWPPSDSVSTGENGAFSVWFDGYSTPAILYIGAVCGMDICSDIVGRPSCSLFPPQAVVEIHVVTEYTIPPTK